MGSSGLSNVLKYDDTCSSRISARKFGMVVGHRLSDTEMIKARTKRL